MGHDLIKTNQLKGKLERYSSNSNGLSRKISKRMTSSTLAVFAVLPFTQAAIVYSGIQNIPVPGGGGSVGIDVNGGGDDFAFRKQAFGADSFFQFDPKGAATAFQGINNAGFGYPHRNSSNLFVGNTNQVPPGTVGGFGNSFAGQIAYPNHQWNGMADNEEGFVGFRLSGNLFGWIRIRFNTEFDWTIVDWAYDNTPNTPISPGSTLPVELTDFSAVKGETQITLRWQTESELNNAGFEIQRSKNGINFNTISFVEGNGNSNTPIRYLFDDKNLREGQMYYYRLKQIDFDGRYSLSDIISIQLDFKAPEISLFPNPITNGSLFLEYKSETQEDLKLQIFNSYGVLIEETVYAVQKGPNNIKLTLKNPNSEVVFIKLEQGDFSHYQKLILI
ncbi:MAG: hypothetical protein AAGA77_02970 [Bacteroidota bacterium]